MSSSFVIFAVCTQEELIKQLQAERDTLSSKLAFLTEEHTRMTQLYHHQQQQQQQQQETDVQPPLEENQDDGSGHTVAMAVSHEPEQLSPQSIAQLQANFAALQVSVDPCTVETMCALISVLGPLHSVDDREG